MLAPVPLLRLKGLILLIAGVIGFIEADVSWWWFLGLLLAPDISMAGYLIRPDLGAAVYTPARPVGPAVLLGWHYLGGPKATLAVGSIWLAHIGMDRLFGYGLEVQGRVHPHPPWDDRRGWGLAARLRWTDGPACSSRGALALPEVVSACRSGGPSSLRSRPPERSRRRAGPPTKRGDVGATELPEGRRRRGAIP